MKERGKWILTLVLILVVLAAGILWLLPGYLSSIGYPRLDSPLDDPDFDPSAVPLYVELTEGERFDVHYIDTPVTRVIHDMARRAGAEVEFIDQPPAERTTIKLRNVHWRQVLEVVLEPIGLTYLETGNEIEVVAIEALLEEGLMVRAFPVNGHPDDYAASLSPLIDSSAGGFIFSDNKRNAVVVVEHSSRMNDIHAIIKRMDEEHQSGSSNP